MGIIDNERVKIEKIVPGGQGLGTLEDGRKVFLWNALPGEEVEEFEETYVDNDLQLVDTITLPLADGSGTWTFGLTDEQLNLSDGNNHYYVLVL